MQKIFSVLLLVFFATPVFASNYPQVGLSQAKLQKKYPGAYRLMLKSNPICFHLKDWTTGDNTICGQAALVAIEKEETDAKH